ncbi:hypothetical protein GCM10023160_23540 [Brachybacterium paraconglomeratum]|uniref:hypothetical protein n=1 Tax=Brachybacterium paraconglomeratum TaxID=173362 RepID=UPI0031F19A9D
MEKTVDRFQVLLAIFAVALIIGLPIGLYFLAVHTFTVATDTFDAEWALEENWNVLPAGGAELIDAIEDKDGFHGDGSAVYVYGTADSPPWILPDQASGTDHIALLTAHGITEQLAEVHDVSAVPELTACRSISVQADGSELIECRTADPNIFVLAESMM